jgi:hypothetical protein
MDFISYCFEVLTNGTLFSGTVQQISDTVRITCQVLDYVPAPTKLESIISKCNLLFGLVVNMQMSGDMALQHWNCIEPLAFLLLFYRLKVTNSLKENPEELHGTLKKAYTIIQGNKESMTKALEKTKLPKFVSQLQGANISLDLVKVRQ